MPDAAIEIHNRRGSRLQWQIPAINRDRAFIIGLIGILAVATTARFLFLGSRPGWEWDEPVYTSIARSVADGHGLHVTTQYGTSGEPYLYHPPFYFLAVGGWMKIFGTSITSARYFAATASIIYTLITALAIRRLVGPLAGLSAALFVSCDAWLLFENRVGWIDNAMMIFFMLSVYAFAVAWRGRLTPGADRRWALFGLAVGGAIIFKHLSLALLPGYAGTWAILWNGKGNWRPTRAAIIAATATAAVAFVYVGGMIAVFPHAYLRETGDQWLRATGSHSSNGNVTVNPNSLVQAVQSHYWLYTGTIASTAVAFLTGLKRMWARKFDESLVLWCLGTGSAIFMLVLGMRFPNYTIMVFVPMVAYFGVVISQQGRSRSKPVIGALLVGLLVLNAGGTIVRETWSPDNALRQGRDWLANHSEPSDVVIADEPFGNITSLHYCRSTYAERCGTHWTWIVTYTSLTQRLPDTLPFQQDLADAVKCVEFTGFKEHVSVYVRGHGTCYEAMTKLGKTASP